MKKFLLSLLFTFGVIIVMAQSVPREMVIMEIGTGTWCTYCPGAAMGADDLLANGCKVAVMENHNGDPFANVYSNARNTFYSISGFPTAVFDGATGVVGGNHSTSMYPSYLPKYNQQIAVPSNMQMNINMTNTGLNYTAVITMTKIGTITATDLKLRFSVTVSHITYNWQGQTHLNFVNVLMVPDADGTTVDFSGGNVQVVTLNFAMDPLWNLADCEFIAFVQSDQTGAIQQGMKRGTIDLTPGFTVSATQIQKNQPVTFTNTTTGGYIGTPETYSWSFPGGTPSTSTDKDPVVTYANCGEYDVTLIVDRGGQIDTLLKPGYITVGTVVNVNALPNDTSCWDVPITLDATTPNATYLWQPGGATTPSIVIAYPQYGYGSHTFNVTVNTPDGCETNKSVQVYIDACTGIAEQSNNLAVSVYPNPNQGVFTIEAVSQVNIEADLIITNTLGERIYRENSITINGKLTRNVKLDNLRSGIYFLTLQNGSTRITQKIFVK